MFDRPIVIGLSPNTSRDDYIEALKIIVQPWKWRNGKAIHKVEEWFKDYFRAGTAVSFNAGRSALLAILKSLELEKGSEILLQAFTCVSVPNSIIWAGLKPMYVDVDKSLNVDVSDAEQKLTEKTKALVVQHTFGTPADMEKILAFCKKHNLFLIEDCAHSLGATYRGKLLGTFGDAAFFSFGRDKIISSVFGGAAITNNKSLGNKIAQYRNNLHLPSYFWIFQQLLHPLLSSIALVLYHVLNLGKFILFISQKLYLLSFPVYDQEKMAKQPAYFPQKYSNALATLVLNQLNKLYQMNHQRREIAKIYFEKLNQSQFHLPEKNSGSVYLRFNVLSEKANELRFKAKQKGIILGNWYSHIIDPKGVDLTKVGYEYGSCPKAEKAARESLNLPTYPYLTDSQVNYLLNLLKK